MESSLIAFSPPFVFDLARPAVGYRTGTKVGDPLRPGSQRRKNATAPTKRHI